MADEIRWTKVTEADQVSEELLEHALTVADGHYGDDDRIDWEDVIYRVEGFELPDGSRVDFGSEDANNPAIRRIKAYVRKVRRESPR